MNVKHRHTSGLRLGTPGGVGQGVHLHPAAAIALDAVAGAADNEQVRTVGRAVKHHIHGQSLALRAAKWMGMGIDGQACSARRRQKFGPRLRVVFGKSVFDTGHVDNPERHKTPQHRTLAIKSARAGPCRSKRRSCQIKPPERPLPYWCLPKPPLRGKASRPKSGHCARASVGIGQAHQRAPSWRGTKRSSDSAQEARDRRAAGCQCKDCHVPPPRKRPAAQGRSSQGREKWPRQLYY